MKRKIPSTVALQIFETAARHGSFARAADELALTEGAVSRQIGRLEEFLGLQLFHRTGNRVQLSGPGAGYAVQVRESLMRIERDTLRLMAQPLDGGVLELAVIPTFTNKWLIPRLCRFSDGHPGITVNLSERAEPFLFTVSPFDAAIHFDHPAWTGMIKRELFQEALVPVCSPALVSSLGDTLNDLNRLPLLHKTSTPDAWREYSVEMSLTLDNPMRGSRYDLYSMIIEAAVAGLGVALVPRLYVDEEVRNGKLMTPFAASRNGHKTYCVIVPEEKRDLPVLKAFLGWLDGETARYISERNH
jgi:DNA-binding transcriptional LysR family regulator